MPARRECGIVFAAVCLSCSWIAAKRFVIDTVTVKHYWNVDIGLSEYAQKSDTTARKSLNLAIRWRLFYRASLDGWIDGLNEFLMSQKWKRMYSLSGCLHVKCAYKQKCSPCQLNKSAWWPSMILNDVYGHFKVPMWKSPISSWRCEIDTFY